MVASRGDAPPPARLRAWILAARVPTLSAAIVPVMVGTAAAVADGYLHLLAAVAALAASVLIQIGTNLVNDYFDYQKGADRSGRVGPVRVTQSGLIPPRQVLLGAIVAFGVSILLGAYLVTVGGWPIVAIGLLCIAAGVLYTAGPWPLGYHGLGDLTVFVFFGLVAVVGTTYLHAGAVTARALVYSVPVGLIVTAILVVNNLRDIDTDRAAGKRTLAVRIGRTATRAQYATMIAAAYLLAVIPWAVGLGRAWIWLPWLTIPLAFRLIKVVLTEEGAALNKALRDTARLHLLFGSLLAAGLVL